VIEPEDLRLERVHGTLVVRLRGEIDLSNAALIKHLIAESISNQEMGLVVDLGAVNYLDSAGIAMLFDLSRRLARHQQRLTLVMPAKSFIRRSLRVSGWPSEVPIVATVEEATARSLRLEREDPEG
jgi:anti-sigma B factor antagonist